MDTANCMEYDPELISTAHLLIVEIGNSHVAVATLISDSVRTHQRFSHSEIEALLNHAEEAWEALDSEQVKAIAIGSVVPKVMEVVREGLERRIDSHIFVVGEELHRPMSLAVESPEKVGIDRICSAAAAYEVIGRACVVASFGTAITIDCVNDEGTFMGGAILPGLALQARALHEGTAALPLVKIESTTEVYGSNTESAIRNGVLVGAVGALREITERYATELHVWPQLVVTGGGAELVKKECEFIDSLVPDLCVRGIGLAFRKHFSPLAEEE
jgi:type III pantothenate kinase